MSGFVARTWTAADGLTLAGRDYAPAAGPARLPVVCLHGLTRNARDFEGVAPVISASGRRVLALDMRGRGRSAWSPDPATYALPTYAADVVRFAVAAGIGRAVFVGTSMGGLITMALAALSPTRVAAAVLNDIGPVIAPEGLARIAAYVGGAPPVSTWEEAVAYARATNAHAFPTYGDADWARFARRVFRDAGGRPVLDYDPAIALPFRTPPPAPAPPTPDPWKAFAAFGRRPLLLVRGATSDLLAPATADRMKAEAPTMRRVDVPGVGHAPMLDEPDAAEALAAFLAEVE